jgi:hypothetical protein
MPSPLNELSWVPSTFSRRAIASAPSGSEDPFGAAAAITSLLMGSISRSTMAEKAAPRASCLA